MAMTGNDKVLSMIGLAARAGKVVSGEFSTEKAVKSGKAFLTIVAEDASANTRKNFTDMCAYYQVPIRIYGTKEDKEVGHVFHCNLYLEEGEKANRDQIAFFKKMCG